MKKYMTPSLELQMVSSEDIMTASNNVNVAFGGLNVGTDYVGESLDFSDFQ